MYKFRYNGGFLIPPHLVTDQLRYVDGKVCESITTVSVLNSVHKNT